MTNPLFTSLASYNRRWLSGDIVAGLTVWAVLIPEALAYASIAGVSPVVGLYAAPPALLLYAAFGSSRHLIVGPMSATAALSAAAVADVAAGGDDFAALTATLAICTGIVGLVAGLLRLGFLANFISEPVLKGFIIGLALTIIVGQLPKVFGVEGGDGNFFEKLWDFLGNLGDVDDLTLLVGAISLAIVLGLRRTAPAVPGSLVAVLFGIAVVTLFDLDDHGVSIVGNIDSGLPSLGLPDVDESNYMDIAASAVGVLLVGFAEGLGAAKTYAARNHYEVDANKELMGLGAANVASGLSSGMVVNGSLSKTAVNGSAGANSQLSGIIVALLTIVTLLFLTGLFEELPEATLGAVVIAAVLELVNVEALVRLYRVHVGTSGIGNVAGRPDFIAAVAALMGVLVFDTLPGLFIGIAVSLLLLLYRASTPRIAVLGRDSAGTRFEDIARHPEDEQVPGIVVLRVEGGLFFANAESIQRRIRDAAATEGTKAVVVDAETAPFIDVSAARVLLDLAEELEETGVDLVIARGPAQFRDVVSEVGEQQKVSLTVYPDVRTAVRELVGDVGNKMSDTD